MRSMFSDSSSFVISTGRVDLAMLPYTVHVSSRSPPARHAPTGCNSLDGDAVPVAAKASR